MATGLFALLSASAYGQINQLRADIPFDFRAGNQVLPAGEYRVDINVQAHRLELRNLNGSGAAYLAAHPDSMDLKEMSTVVFHQYGKTHFLRAVRLGGSACEYETWPTKAELEMAKAGLKQQIALVHADR